MRILIVHNPRSGFGSDAIFEFQRALLEEGDECVMRLLTPDRDANAAALADAEGFDLVTISGGDGTVADLLYLLRGRDVPTCVFPSGTANLTAANIGNATEPAALAAACRAGSTARCDLGQISWSDDAGERHAHGFALMAGTGFDAQLMHDARPSKQVLGEAAYFAAALANPKPTVLSFAIEVDGVTYHHEGISCMVANNAKLQGDIELVPDCSMADGFLDVIVLESTATPQLLAPLMAGIVDPTGRGVGRPNIATHRGQHIKISCDRPTRMEIDGDVMPGTVSTWEADVIPSCSRIVVDRLSPYAALALENR